MLGQIVSDLLNQTEPSITGGSFNKNTPTGWFTEKGSAARVKFQCKSGVICRANTHLLVLVNHDRPSVLANGFFNDVFATVAISGCQSIAEDQNDSDD